MPIDPRTSVLHKIMNVVADRLIFDKNWDKPKREEYFNWFNGPLPIYRVAFLTFAEEERFVNMGERSPRIYATEYNERFPRPWTSKQDDTYVSPTAQQTPHYTVRAANGNIVATDLLSNNMNQLMQMAFRAAQP